MKKLDDAKLIQLSTDAFSRLKDPSITIRERIWFRNILYYVGEQWLDWIVSTNTFRRIQPSKHTPTPVANIIRDHVRSMKALILNKDFSIKIWPNSMDQEDKDAAKMGEFLLKHMDAENDESFVDETEKACVWMVLSGLGLLRTIPIVGDSEWGIDPKTGEPTKKAEVTSFNWSPFSFACPAIGDDIMLKPWIGFKSLKNREWVEDTFKLKVNRNEKEEPVINYEKKLAKLVASVSPWKGQGVEDMVETHEEDEDLVLFKEFEFAPNAAMPNGRYVGIIGDQIAFDIDRMPIPVQKGQGTVAWYYTATDYRYHYIPGRFWPDSAVDDLISPQNTINEIDKDLEMNRKGLARPMVFLPSKARIKRATKYGRHLLAVYYDPLTAGGQKPTVEPGVPYPSQVLEERAIHRATIQDVAGDPRNVLRGNAPTQSASGIMVDILRDAAEQGHFPDITRFYRSHKRTYRKRLILAGEVYTQERMVKVSGRGHGVEVRAFKAADLRGNTDVRLELASGLASTRVGQTQMMLQLTEAGFFSQQSDIDPEFRDELLKRMGLSGFKDKTSVDVDRASRENTLVANTLEDGFSYKEVETMYGVEKIPYIEGIWLTIQNPKGIGLAPDEIEIVASADPSILEPIMLGEDELFPFDDHAVHYEIHRKFLLSPEFRNLDDEAKAVLVAHTQEHKAMIEMQMMEEQQKMAAAQAQMTAAQQPPQMPGEAEMPGEPSAAANMPPGY
jgi:hypothetical protein